jgi:hypothetical protein
MRQEYPTSTADLFHQSVYSRIAGYEDVNDAGRFSQDPTFRLIVRRKLRIVARRVVAKIEFHFGELFLRVGFIVTNLETDSRAVCLCKQSDSSYCRVAVHDTGRMAVFEASCRY